VKTNSDGAQNSTGIFNIPHIDPLAVLYRGKWIVLGVFVVVFATVFILTFRMKPSYTATSSVLIDTKQAPSTLFQGLPGRALTITENELQILQSNSLAEDVARRLLEQKYVDPANEVPIPIIQPSEGDTSQRLVATVEQVVARLAKSVQFKSIRDSDIIKITVTSQNPQEAALIANAYAKAYYDRNVYMSRIKSRSFREFLGAQAKVKHEDLRKAEEAVQDYMQPKRLL